MCVHVVVNIKFMERAYRKSFDLMTGINVVHSGTKHKNYFELKKNLKKDFSSFKVVKIALLGDSATQFLVQALKGQGYEAGINFDIFEADYDQIERQVFDSTSELYNCKPEFVIIFHATQKLIKRFYKLSTKEKSRFAELHVNQVTQLYETITATYPCRIIYFNFPDINDAIFGNYANKVDISFTYQLRKLNYEFMLAAQKCKNLFIADVCALHHQYGSSGAVDPKMYINADMVFSLDFLPVVAKHIVDIIQAVSGKFKKCLIMDLDNTLWGGIIGDDGTENIQIGDLGIGKAFTELQHWIKQLKQRGIILTVCSKNDEKIAKEPFEKHPDMVLRLDDIALFVANWDNKADNIRYIQAVLNIGFDSMVFLDDNPFEREMVRTHIPDIEIPELPEDPAEYLSYLQSLNLFETASYTGKDEQRTRQYQEEAKRSVAQKMFTSEDDFLASLAMFAEVKPFDKFTAPRVAQLTQRSNQFNLRTIRYTEDEIQKIMSSEDYYTRSFTLQDKFGDNGLISIVILKKNNSELFVDTWIMSCRVLKRGVENLVLNEIVSLAKQHGCGRIVGEYIPTAKNGLVKDHYASLGFYNEIKLWKLDVGNYVNKKHFIQIN
jgi:FkbH-like protein